AHDEPRRGDVPRGRPGRAGDPVRRRPRTVRHQGRRPQRGRPCRHRIAGGGFSTSSGGARTPKRPSAPARERQPPGRRVLARSHIAVEPRVRRVVAASIGRDAESLKPATVLGLDPLALLDAARALEHAFGVTLPEADLDRVRTCRDFASLVARLIASQTAPEPPETGPVWIRVIPADTARPLLERLVELSPYMVQTIIEDARVPGRSRRLEVILGPGHSERVAAHVEAVFAPARAAGLVVEVHREGRPRAARPEPAAEGDGRRQLPPA